MRVSTLKYQNFKGHSAAIELAPVTVIRGTNFRHKTSIPLALRLGMAGKLPPPIGIKGIYPSLAGNPEAAGEMTIDLEFDNGRKLNWKWIRNSDGSIKTEGGVTADIAMPELMLDPSLFFAKTAAEQVQTVFAVCEVDDSVFSIRSVLDRLGEVDASPVAVRDLTISRITNFMGASEPENIQKWFTAVLNNLTTQQKAARDRAKTAKGAFEAYRGQDGSIPQDVSAILAAKCSERDRLMAQCSDPAGRIDFLKTRLAEYGSKEAIKAAIDEAGEMDPLPGYVPEDHAEYMDELLTTLGGQTAKLSRVLGELENAKAKLAELEHLEACPYCKAAKKGWKTAVRTNLEAIIATNASERDLLNEDIAKAKELTTAIDKYEEAQKRLSDYQEKLDRFEAFEKELAELEGQKAEGPPVELLNEIRNLEAANLAFQVWKTNRAQREKLEQDLLKAQCEEAVYKAVTAIVIEEQDKVIVKVFGKVLNVARHFTDGLLNSRLEFQNGELGRRVSSLDTKQGNTAPPGSWIPFNGFSGTERLLALAGFSVALTGDAPCKLVVLDEMGNLDLSRRTEVALRMLSLVESGVIDQAILIDVDERPYVPLIQRPGFKLMAV